ncbi:MAG: cob(I)yrinic acid a,c-diamide adenosyltransferase [Verrucomicrobiales bacterium]|nr:cob(I)yrinic acid a,c-diamide adenosyltransferase [Verrucomicrobiales bacterium]
MSIATRTGDAGTTGLMYGKRVPKDDARVEAYGTADELNAALGAARAAAADDWARGEILTTQKELVTLMGELAVADADFQKYQDAKYPKLTDDMLARLDKNIAGLEAQNIRFEGWAAPGDTPSAAALDVARTVCRRTERRVCTLSGRTTVRPLLVKYLNRLSDFLWLLARQAESRR